MNILAWLH